jgi:hypothetical protein
MVLGILCLMVVVFGDIAEYFNIFPAVGWDRSDSPASYFILISSLVGVSAVTAWLIYAVIKVTDSR